MSKMGQQHPYVTGDIYAMMEDPYEIQDMIKECHREMDEDPEYQEWADSYDAETLKSRSERSEYWTNWLDKYRRI